MYNLMIPKNPNSIIFQDYKFRFFYNEEFINNHFKKLDDNQYALEWVDYINATINLNNIEIFDDFSKIIVKGFDKTYLFTVMSIQFNSADKRNVTLRLELDMIFELSKIENWAINGTVKYSTFKELTFDEDSQEYNKNSILVKEGIDTTSFYKRTKTFNTPILKYNVLKSIKDYWYIADERGKSYIRDIGAWFNLVGNRVTWKGGYSRDEVGPFYINTYDTQRVFTLNKALKASDNIVKTYVSMIPTCFIAPNALGFQLSAGERFDKVYGIIDTRYMYNGNKYNFNGYTLYSKYTKESEVYDGGGVDDGVPNPTIYYSDEDNYLCGFKNGNNIIDFYGEDEIVMVWFNYVDYFNFIQMCVLTEDGYVYANVWDNAWINDKNWYSKFKSKSGLLKLGPLYGANFKKWVNLDWPEGEIFKQTSKPLNQIDSPEVPKFFFYRSLCMLLGKFTYFPFSIPTDYAGYDYGIWNYGTGTKDFYGLIGLIYEVDYGENRKYKYYDYKIYNHEEFVDIYISSVSCFQQLTNWNNFPKSGVLKLKLNEFPSLQTNSILRLQYYQWNNNKWNKTKNYQWIDLSSTLEVLSNDWYNYLLSNSSQYQTAKSYADTQLKLSQEQLKWDTAGSVSSAIGSIFNTFMGSIMFGSVFDSPIYSLFPTGAMYGTVGSGVSGVGSTVVSSKQKIASAQNAINQLNSQKKDLQRTNTLNYQTVNYINSRKQVSYDLNTGISFITFEVNDATAEVLKKHFFMYGWNVGMVYRINKDLFTRDFEYLEMDNCVFEETPVINQDAITKLLKEGVFVFNNNKNYNEITSLYQLNGWE